MARWEMRKTEFGPRWRTIFIDHDGFGFIGRIETHAFPRVSKHYTWELRATDFWTKDGDSLLVAEGRENTSDDAISACEHACIELTRQMWQGEGW